MGIKRVTIFDQKLKILNCGLELFYDELKLQKADVEKVAWQPPAKGKKNLLEALRKLS